MTPEDVQRIAFELGEHFDSVQILVSKCEEGYTRCIKRGAGNWYARHAMCQEFINTAQAIELAEAIKPE